MTAPSGHTTVSTDTIEVEVDVTAAATHDRVTVRIRNGHPEAVAVRLEQPVVPGVTPSQVAVDAAYETDPWSDKGDALVFFEKIPGEGSVETAYAVGGADTSTVRDFLRAVTVEVRGMNGEQLTFIEGSNLRVNGTPLGNEGAGQRRASDLPASISDYVLQDVGGVSAGEFDWRPVEAESRGLLRRLIPFL